MRMASVRFPDTFPILLNNNIPSAPPEFMFCNLSILLECFERGCMYNTKLLYHKLENWIVGFMIFLILQCDCSRLVFDVFAAREP